MTTPRAEPLYFGPPIRPVAGWLHRSDAPATGGVVICNPFGYEMLCAHRSLRHLAESLAKTGLPALRFDYDGTGDSAGRDEDGDRLNAWVRSTVEACAALREHTGVERVWLAGVRLGALVATLAAPEANAAGLIAIAPVISGKAHVRELRALHSALGLAAPPFGVVARETDEAIGFAITGETRASLIATDLTKTTGRPSPEVLILDRSDLPSADRWIPRLKEQGAEVDARRIDGYVEMVLDPHKAVVPTAIIEAATTWVKERANKHATSGSPPPSAAPLTAKAADLGEVSERPVFMDSARLVFGIETSPRAARPSGRAVLLLNAGAIHHIGPNRLHVAYARAWAAAGHRVVRMDITGIGDSPTRAGKQENIVYSDSALGDVDTAIRWVRRQPDVKDVWLVGLCSGAYHAFKSAVAGHDVTGFVAINPLTFFWTPNTPLDPAAHTVIEEAERYRNSILDPSKWKKLLEPEVRARVAITLQLRAKSVIMAKARDLSRRLNMAWKDDLAAELELVANKGVDQNFVFAEGDPGEELLRRDGGSVVRELVERGALDIDTIPGPDHTFTSIWSHDLLLALLGRAMVSQR